jgi:RNA-binding protein
VLSDDAGPVTTMKGSDRRHLRGLANPMRVIVQIGDAGLTDGVIAAADAGLREHELIKVRMPAGDRVQRREIAARISDATHSEIAGVVGRVAIFYRPADDPTERKIRLPSAIEG